MLASSKLFYSLNPCDTLQKCNRQKDAKIKKSICYCRKGIVLPDYKKEASKNTIKKFTTKERRLWRSLSK